MKPFLTICVLMALAPRCAATSVLVIETEDNVIYLAADSLLTETSAGRRFHNCKIQRSGAEYWAAAGNFYATSAGFSVEKIVASIGTGGTVTSKMQKFTAALKSPLAGQVSLFEKINPKEYAKYLAGTHTPLEIAFVGVEDGKPAWAITRFYVKKVKGRLTIDPRPEKRVGAPLVTGVGFWGPAAEYAVAHNQEFYSGNAASLIKNSLDAAALKDTYKGVEGPYSILRLDKDGYRWLEKGKCD